MRRLSIFFCMFLLICQAINSHVTVWDLGGVLIDYQLSSLLKYYPLKQQLKSCISLIKIFGRHPGTFNVKKIYLQTLETLPYKSTVPYSVYSDDGITTLPDLLKDAQLGLVSYETAQKAWYHSPKPYFLNTIFEFNFNPDLFISGQVIRTNTVKLLQQCATQQDEHACNKNVCIILSNMDATMVPLIKKKFKTEIMDYVDLEHSIFSGLVNCAKPDKSIFELLKQKIDALPDHVKGNIIFFDDQKVNRIAAHQYIPNIICAHPDDAETILRAQGIIA